MYVYVIGGGSLYKVRPDFTDYVVTPWESERGERKLQLDAFLPRLVGSF